MANSDEHLPMIPDQAQASIGNNDLRVPLLNLSAVRVRMDSLQRFLTESVHDNRLISPNQMAMVSSEITSAIHQVIINGTSLLAFSQQNTSTNSSAGGIPPAIYPSIGQPVSISPIIGKPPGPSDRKLDAEEEEIDGDDECEIIELDAVELLAEHVHFCEVCGKGFKRDANLRMHMRAHGNQFKTIEALAKPTENKQLETTVMKLKKTRFSCPFQGCNRNRCHNKFKALKSIICVRNHFKRSHCPKMYSCDRCNKKSFSVLADLKSHSKHCGEAKWRCSCGTSFSRKDKLFGHMTLFEGHMPAVMDDSDHARQKGSVAPLVEDDAGFFDGWGDEFGSIEEYCLEDMLGSSPELNADIAEEFCGM